MWQRQCLCDWVLENEQKVQHTERHSRFLVMALYFSGEFWRSLSEKFESINWKVDKSILESQDPRQTCYLQSVILILKSVCLNFSDSERATNCRSFVNNYNADSRRDHFSFLGKDTSSARQTMRCPNVMCSNCPALAPIHELIPMHQCFTAVPMISWYQVPHCQKTFKKPVL